MVKSCFTLLLTHSKKRQKVSAVNGHINYFSFRPQFTSLISLESTFHRHLEMSVFYCEMGETGACFDTSCSKTFFQSSVSAATKTRQQAKLRIKVYLFQSFVCYTKNPVLNEPFQFRLRKTDFFVRICHAHFDSRVDFYQSSEV